jgi:type I restriction enzyme, S subunit
MTKNNWQTVRFGDVVREVRDTENNPLEKDIERYVGLEHLDSDSLVIKRWGLLAEDNVTFKRKFTAGQVLFGRRRAYLRKAAVADFDGICSGDIMVFEPANDGLNPDLLPFIVQSDRFFEYAISTSAGSLSPRTNWSHLAAYEFLLPPPDEQQRIAEILWAAEDVLEKHHAISFLLDTATHSVCTTYLNQNGAGSVLADFCNSKGIQIGPFGSQLHSSDYVTQGIPVIMPSDMINGEISTEKIARITSDEASRLAKHQVCPGDILLPRRGDLGKRAYVKHENSGWICGTGSIRIRLADPSLSRAMFYAISSKEITSWLERFAVGTTMPNLNTEIVSKIPVALPTGHKLAILVETLENLEICKQDLVNKIETLNNLKKTILQIMVGGYV